MQILQKCHLTLIFRLSVQQRPAAGSRINSKTATIAKKPTAAVDGYGNGGMAAGRGLKKLNDSGGGMTNTNRLLLPPVVQPTVINALAAGASAAAAVASVSEAAAAGVQKPMFRAARLPPATQKSAAPSSAQKPVAPPARPRPAAVPSKAAAKQPIARKTPAPAAAATAIRPTSTRKQLSEDRGPPANGMARCPLCARDFASDRLPKHEEVCRRTRDRDRKRKVFDASRKRLEAVAAEAGVDVASFKKKVGTTTGIYGENISGAVFPFRKSVLASLFKIHIFAKSFALWPLPRYQNAFISRFVD